jgi:uncharacterized membrane protein
VGIGTGIVLAAVGAILDFAVTTTTSGFNIHTVGVILMVAGAVAIVLSMVFWSSWGGFGSRSGGGYRREHRVVNDGAGGYLEEDRGTY